MTDNNKYAILKNLTSKELKEICKQHEIQGFSGLKQKELAKFASENIDLSLEEIDSLAKRYMEDRLLGKIKDVRDYFMVKQVEIEYFDDDFIKARVGGYSITIKNLGTDDFSYTCDERCQDWLYQVKKGKYPFCKHYPAVIAELIYRGDIAPKVKPNHLSGKVYDALLELVKERRKEDGLTPGDERNIEETLKKLKSDFWKISIQDSKLAREKYHDKAEKTFETLVDEAFLLLEFDTIPRRREHGWDLLLIGTHATPPYIAVVECKTAASGIYDYLTRDPDYLVRLKSYCIDMTRDKLIGVYRDYVKYMSVVGPDFPKEVETFCSRFKHFSDGIKLSFLPVPVLLYLVEKYRENPIVTHTFIERLFMKGGIISETDIDSLFSESTEYTDALISRAKDELRRKMEEFTHRTTDACFIKLDSVILQSIIDHILSILEPDLVKIGVKESTGIETISIKHDYFKIWELILHSLADEFTQILTEESFSQIKRTELKEELIRFLDVH
jgi:hypothetical protein